MAKSVTTTTTVNISGDGYGGQGPFYNETITNASGLPPYSATLTTGFNSIAIPATALGCTIVPPAGSAVTLILKGITGDTGLPIDPANSTRLKWTAAQNATFGITAGGAVTVQLIWE